jgi:hypothetical protein
LREEKALPCEAGAKAVALARREAAIANFMVCFGTRLDPTYEPGAGFGIVNWGVW